MSSQGEYLDDDPLWYKDAIIYEVHLRAFFDSNGDGVGDFKGLTSKLDYLEDLGVTAIWVLPFYPSPLKDDGYDISDYFGVHPQYGTLKDFKKFLEEAHRRGIKVVTELVLNHTSDQHKWFQKSRAVKADKRWRNFYVWNDTPNKYAETRIIFRDFESSNWAWDPVAKAYYWHRFYSHQPDLNYDNLDTQEAVIQALNFWLGLGVDGMRLDAVPYLFEREGTNCENLPETHSFLKKLRTYVDARFKNRMLLAEANQWPSDAASYLGNGDECHMAFHFPLMPRMFMAIQLEDRFPLIDILNDTPSIPENCQWTLFLRNHDELTLEMVTDEERDYMYRVYARHKETRINLGIRRRLAPLLENDRRKMELMNVMLFTLPGTPVIYYGDEIGMGDNYSLGDRNGVRTPMQWSADMNAGFSTAHPQKLFLPTITSPRYHYEVVNVENQRKDQNSLLWWMREIIALRKSHKSLGRGTIDFQFCDNNRVLAFVRHYGNETLLVTINLSRHTQVAEFDFSRWEGCAPREVFGEKSFPPIGRSTYTLIFEPYGYYIFSLTRDEETVIPRIDAKPELRFEKTLNELFSGKPRERFETVVLPAFIKGCRWFGGKSREIELVKIRDALTIEHERMLNSYITILDVYYKEGLPETYLLPIAYALGNNANEVSRSQPKAVIANLAVGREKGVVFDGTFDKHFQDVLLKMIVRNKTTKGGSGELVGSHHGNLLRLVDTRHLNLGSNILGAEQSNTSIIYEDKLILKLFRRVEDGMNPELEIGNALTASNFPHIAPLLGDIKYVESGAEPIIAAILQGFVKNEGDAWKLCLDELERYYHKVSSVKDLIPDIEIGSSILDLANRGVSQQLIDIVGMNFLELMKLLGKRTGEFHLALLAHRNDPDFTPEPFGYLHQVALSHSMTSYAKRILQSAARLKTIGEDVKPELQMIIGNQNLLLDRFKALTKVRIDALRIRTHGDYHLGQVLYTGNDFVMIDYEGEPARAISERRLRRSPLRDVAGMIRSFHYATYVALSKLANIGTEDLPVLEKWADLWYKCTATVFLKAYLAAVAESGIIPRNNEALATLLDALLLEKAIYELGYEMNNRPDWVAIPIRGINDTLGLKGPSARKDLTTSGISDQPEGVSTRLPRESAPSQP